MRATEIARLLSRQTESVCRHLYPNGKVVGNEFKIGSVDGETGKSLNVHLTGTKAGWWCDFASGDSGDLIGLWISARKLSLFDAIKEAKKYLGITDQIITSKKEIKPRNVILQIDKPDRQSDVYKYLTEKRLLTTATINAYKVKSKDRIIIFPYRINNKIISVKYLSIDRPNGKKIMWREKDTPQCLFGWDTIPQNARSIVICEGEIDAMTIYQYGYPALSVPLGGGTGNKHNWIEFDYNRLSVFDEIYLCFDKDTSGEKALTQIIDRLGRHRCKVISIPYKDANEALQKGFSKIEFDVFYKSAKTLDPKGVQHSSVLVDDVDDYYHKQKQDEGFGMPFDRVRHLVRFRPSELSIWCGINGHGKSQFIGQIIADYLINSYTIFAVSLELKNVTFLAKLYRQMSASRCPTSEHIKKISSLYGDKLILYDKTSTADIKELLTIFEYVYKRYGVTVFVIDSFMKLNVREEDYSAQKIILDMICDFKNKYDCHIHLITHPRKGANEYEQPNKFDVKGSGGITNLADNCFTIWRNKKKHDEIADIVEKGFIPDRELLSKPDAVINCTKQRNGEWEGKLYLWFDADTFQFLEKNKSPKVYVDL